MSSHALNPPFSWTVIVLRGGTIEREGDDRRIGNEGTESFKLPTGSSRNFAASWGSLMFAIPPQALACPAAFVQSEGALIYFSLFSFFRANAK